MLLILKKILQKNFSPALKKIVLKIPCFKEWKRMDLLPCDAASSLTPGVPPSIAQSPHAGTGPRAVENVGKPELSVLPIYNMCHYCTGFHFGVCPPIPLNFQKKCKNKYCLGSLEVPWGWRSPAGSGPFVAQSAAYAADPSPSPTSQAPSTPLSSTPPTNGAVPPRALLHALHWMPAANKITFYCYYYGIELHIVFIGLRSKHGVQRQTKMLKRGCYQGEV